MSSEQLVGRTRCPRCLDKAQDNLINYSDGGAKCFACGFHRFGSGSTSYVPPTEEQIMTALDLAPYFESRKISKTTLDKYSVKAVTNEETGQASVAFPLVNANNIIESYHYRKLDTANGTLTRDFFYSKGKKVRCPLFGWQLVRATCKTVVVCEGETDTLALAEVLAPLSDVCVVGAVGTGFASKVAAWLLSKAESLRVVLAFDNDKAGREAVGSILEFYSKNSTTTKLLQLKFDAEDIGQAIIDGEPVLEYYKNPVFAVGGELKSAHEIKDDVQSYIDLLHSNDLLTLDFCPTLSNAVRFRATNLITILGDGGTGKSTLAEHILLEVMKHKKRGLMVSVEMSAYEVALKLVSTTKAKPFLHDPFLRSLSADQRKQLSVDVVNICNKFSITDTIGGTGTAGIRKLLLQQEALDMHPDIVIVDHMLGISPSTEVGALEQTANELKGLARDFNTCIVVLCHTKKPPSNNGKSVWRPQSSDEYGSSGLKRWSNAMIGTAIDRSTNQMLIETIKLDRMGGTYADIRLAMSNWQLTELTSEEAPMTTYPDTDEENMY